MGPYSKEGLFKEGGLKFILVFGHIFNEIFQLIHKFFDVTIKATGCF